MDKIIFHGVELGEGQVYPEIKEVMDEIDKHFKDQGMDKYEEVKKEVISFDKRAEEYKNALELLRIIEWKLHVHDVFIYVGDGNGSVYYKLGEHYVSRDRDTMKAIITLRNNLEPFEFLIRYEKIGTGIYMDNDETELYRYLLVIEEKHDEIMIVIRD